MRDKELDEILDAGLKAYSAVEPRPGLERRVLAHVHKAKPLAWWRWLAVAIPVLACAVGLLLWRPGRPITVSPMPTIPTAPPAPRGADSESAAPRLIGAHVRRRARRFPKRIQFPTPAPLTREERALLELVRRSPKEAVELLGENRDSEMKPIQIEAISIPPIKIESLEEQ